MKLLVVDDEKENVRKFERLLKNIDQSIRIVGAVPSINSSAEWINSNDKPDLILVNHQAKQVRELNDDFSATVIFHSPSEKYVFKAYRSNHVEELLKSIPVQQSGMTSSVRSEHPKFARRRFLVKQGQRFASVELEHIAYFYSNGRFIFFKTFDDQKYLVEYTLEELEAMLPAQDFHRINRSLLVSFKSLDQIHPYFGNRIKLLLTPAPEKDVIVSREKVQGFKQWLGQ